MPDKRPGLDYVGVGVGVLVRNGKGEILLGLRSTNSRNEAGKWTFPGGCLEFGEILAQCAVRETKEEYGIDVEFVRLLDVIDHIIPNEKQHWFNPIVEARLLSGEARSMEPHKITKIGWFSLEALPENLTINLVEFFARVKRGEISLD